MPLRHRRTSVSRPARANQLRTAAIEPLPRHHDHRTSNTRSQSFVLVPLSPGVYKAREFLLGSGASAVLVHRPSTGLYQRAVTGPGN